MKRAIIYFNNQVQINVLWLKSKWKGKKWTFKCKSKQNMSFNRLCQSQYKLLLDNLTCLWEKTTRRGLYQKLTKWSTNNSWVGVCFRRLNIIKVTCIEAGVHVIRLINNNQQKIRQWHWYHTYNLSSRPQWLVH